MQFGCLREEEGKGGGAVFSQRIPPEKKVFCLPLLRIYTHTHTHADTHAKTQKHDLNRGTLHTHCHSEKTMHGGQKKKIKIKRQDPSQSCAPRILLLLPGLSAAVRLDAVPRVCTPTLFLLPITWRLLPTPLPSPSHVPLSALLSPRRMPCSAPLRARIGPTAVPKLTMTRAAAKPCCLCTQKNETLTR